ncbi:hypothetical protein BDV33DRAFT_184382 [Aspergillus novoparasiticus]|uniref:Uncharacterized protein n=1 Tax=Aspergillus novoparasiticus TaxID=986946 RepID=A0A5N6E989_9EURO|nr:hypothetical protein BDV33DRAFT_184382 [Aspergillus novoparasiticus]
MLKCPAVHHPFWGNERSDWRLCYTGYADEDVRFGKCYSISHIMTMIAILFACFALSRLRSRVSTGSSGMSRAPMSLLAMNPCP